MSIKSKRRSFLIVAIVSILFVTSSFFVTSNITYDVSARKTKSGANVPYGKNMLSDGKVNVKGNNKTGKWTAQELFNELKFISFAGISDENDTAKSYNDIDDRDVSSHVLWEDESVQERAKSAELRGFLRKKGSSLETGLPNLFLGVAKAATSAASFSLNALFTDSLFGSGSESINLVDIIGGKGTKNSSGGIIGMFFSSIYMPMVVIASVLVAIHLIKKGIMERKFREALSDSLWAILSVVIGIALMRNPDMLAGLPYKVTNEISTCVVGAMHGENCFTGRPTMNKPSRVVSTECMSGVEGIEGFVDGMSCTVWKSFVLEPWAKAQFGYSYNDLYTRNAPEGHKIWKGLPEEIDADTYCVALGSKDPKKYDKGDKVILDNGPSVCNVALYQAYLQTNAHDTVNHSSEGPVYSGLDDRWLDIALPMAKDDSNWMLWTGKNHALSRFGSSFVAMVGAIVTSSLLVVLGIQGAAYKVAGTLLMAFAPLFFLLAMIPDKGRRMFLGWFESVVSSILKYMATALFAIISVLLFSTVLESTSGVTSFVAIVILSSTMFAYRKEVASILGATNYGGERLSNQLAEQIDDAADKGKTVAGGALGGLLAEGKPISGARESLMRERRKGDTVTAKMWQQYNRQKGSGGTKQDSKKGSFKNDDTRAKVSGALKAENIKTKNKKKNQNEEYDENVSPEETDNVNIADENKDIDKKSNDSKVEKDVETKRTVEVHEGDAEESELKEDVKNMSDEEFAKLIKSIGSDDMKIPLNANDMQLLREEYSRRAVENPELMNSELAISLKMAELKDMDMDELKEATDAADRHYMETGEGFSELEASIREYGRRQNFSDDVVEGIIENKKAAHAGDTSKDIPTSQYAGLTGDEAQDLVEEMRQASSLDGDNDDIDSRDTNVTSDESDVKLPDIDNISNVKDEVNSVSSKSSREINENVMSETRQNIVNEQREDELDNSNINTERKEVDMGVDNPQVSRVDTEAPRKGPSNVTEKMRTTESTRNVTSSGQANSPKTNQSEVRNDNQELRNVQDDKLDKVNTSELDNSEEIVLPDVDEIDNVNDDDLDSREFKLPDLDTETSKEIHQELNRNSDDE